MEYVFSDEDIKSVINRYPRLQKINDRTIEGVLDLNAVYKDCSFVDAFNVRITAFNPHSEYVPALYEIGGRTESIAKKWNITDLRDLHRNKTGVACVCVKQLESKKFPSGSPLIIFLEELVVPYLYSLVFFEKNMKWPWGEYSHGSLGLLEYYSEDDSSQTVEEVRRILQTISKEPNWKEYHKQIRKPAPNKICLCGSGRRFNKCHKKAFEGLLFLKKEVERLNVNFISSVR